MVPVDNVGDKQVQRSNKFEALEGVDTGEVQNKQLAVIDKVQEVIQVDKIFVTKGGNQTPKSARKLNPIAHVFNPSEQRSRSAYNVQKESTA